MRIKNPLHVNWEYKIQNISKFHRTYRNTFLVGFCFPRCLLELDLAVLRHQVLDTSDLLAFFSPSLSLDQAIVSDALSHI